MAGPDSLDRQENIGITDKKNVNHLDNFLVAQERQKSQIAKMKKQERLEREKDNETISMIEEMMGTVDIKDKKDEVNNSNIEIKSSGEALSERQKLVRYGMFANLAYSEFTTVREKKLEIHNVILDPLSFNNLDSILRKEKNNNFSEDEEFLWEFVQNDKGKRSNYVFFEEMSSDIQQVIIYSGIGWENQSETLGERLKSPAYGSFADFSGNLYKVKEEDYWKKLEHPSIGILKQLRYGSLIRGLQELKEKKIKENGNILEQIKGNFQVVDYFPKETDKKNSGFGSICLKGKDGEKYFAMRGTEITDWGDIKADFNLTISKLPKGQSEDMVKFIEKNIKPGDKFIIVGHSLGGALTQIATAMYSESITESYTFNSPGAKNLQVPSEGKGLFFDKMKEFEYYKDKEKTGDLITNVKGMSGISLISNLGEDIGNYEIRLEDLSSHSITKLIEYVLATEANELKKIHIEETDKKKTDPQK